MSDIDIEFEVLDQTKMIEKELLEFLKNKKYKYGAIFLALENTIETLREHAVCQEYKDFE